MSCGSRAHPRVLDAGVAAARRPAHRPDAGCDPARPAGRDRVPPSRRLRARARGADRRRAAGRCAVSDYLPRKAPCLRDAPESRVPSSPAARSRGSCAPASPTSRRPGLVGIRAQRGFELPGPARRSCGRRRRRDRVGLGRHPSACGPIWRTRSFVRAREERVAGSSPNVYRNRSATSTPPPIRLPIVAGKRFQKKTYCAVVPTSPCRSPAAK